MHKRFGGPARALTALAMAATATLAVTGCAGSAGPAATDGGITNDESATLVVWTDAVREPGFKAYAEANPDVKIDIVVVADADVPTKIQLANQTKSGWPDVIFLPTSTVAAQLATPAYDFVRSLDDVVDVEVLEGFGSALDVCTIDGKPYCLRNDLAPSVLYYNTATFAEFGYEVPATMEDFVALAEDIGENHPGYEVQINGALGQAYVNQFYAASGCPVGELQGPAEVKIDWSDPKCARVTEALDRLLASGTLNTNTLNAAQQGERGSQGKVVMTVNAIWRADASFPEAWQWPEGTLGVAPMPVWGDGEGDGWTGSEGGAGVVVSKHSKNLEGAVEIAQWITTNPDYQLTAPGLPAYEELRADWLAKKVPANTLYADPDAAAEVFLAASQNITPTWEWTAFSPTDAFTQAVVPKVQQGGTFESGIKAVQELSANLARVAGYTVVE